MLAVCGIVRRKGRVLMCRRSSSVPFPGRWELPTEMLEDDDPAENALERVFFERLMKRFRALEPHVTLLTGLNGAL